MVEDCILMILLLLFYQSNFNLTLQVYQEMVSPKVVVFIRGCMYFVVLTQTTSLKIKMFRTYICLRILYLKAIQLIQEVHMELKEFNLEFNQQFKSIIKLVFTGMTLILVAFTGNRKPILPKCVKLANLANIRLKLILNTAKYVLRMHCVLEDIT